MKKVIAIVVAAGLFMSAGMFAQAQDYTTSPIRFVVSTGPGTITDTVTRLIAQDLTDQLKQTFVVEDRVGANGTIAVRFVSNSKPDGLTFLIGNVSTHAANEFLYKHPSYDAQKEFVPVALMGSVPQVLIVPNKSPVKTLADLVQLSKEKPQKLNFATASSLGIVVTDAVTHAAGIEKVLIPYNATPHAINEMMAGRIDATVVDLGVAKSFINAGTVRPLLVTMAEKTPLLPNVPAMPDAGLPKYDIKGWFGLFAPTGTPKQAITRMAEAVRRAAEREENIKKMAVYGVQLSGIGPDAFGKFVLNQRELYKKLIKESGIQIQ